MKGEMRVIHHVSDCKKNFKTCPACVNVLGVILIFRRLSLILYLPMLLMSGIGWIISWVNWVCNEVGHYWNFGSLVKFSRRCTLRLVQYYVEEFVLDFLHSVNKRFSCCCPDLISICYDGLYIYYVRYVFIMIGVFCRLFFFFFFAMNW